MTSTPPSPPGMADLGGLSRAANDRRAGFALFTMVVLSLVIQGAAAFPATRSWTALVFLAALNLSLLAAWIVRERDAVLLRWVVVALVAGLAELAADWYGVTRAGPLEEGLRTGTLIYGPEPTLWASPRYMPLAWTGTLVQFMALSTWLRDRWRTGLVVAAVALFGALYMPLNEHMGRAANWWVYVRSPMLMDNAPYYIAAGEGLLCIPVVYAGRAAAAARWPRLIAWGLGLGAAIFAAYWIGFALTGGCDAGYPWPARAITVFAERFDVAHGCAVPRSVW